MRERTRFEAELVALGLRAASPAALPRREFEVDDLREYQARVRPVADPLAKFRIQGGLYSAAEKKYAITHPKGFMLTAPVLGKEERSLGGRAPATLTVSKELARFEGGRLGDYVQNYNDFSNLFEEVLRHIGRMRDLLSVGAPEAPTDLSKAQQHTLRPTDNSEATLMKKELFDRWRGAQQAYAEADSRGNLAGGRIHESLAASREFYLARQDFWQAQGELRRTIAEAKRLGKPTFDLDIKLNDLAEIVMGINVVDSGLGLLHVVDYMLEARNKRKEYDAKMKVFADVVKNTNEALRDRFEAMKNAGERYWTRLETYRTSLIERDKARVAARAAALRFGQAIAPTSEKRDPVLALLRMPAAVSDAWRALAIVGPAALKKLQAVLTSKALLDRANFHYAKPDPLGLDDITQIRKSYARAASWTGVLTKDDVEEWVAMDKLWQEVFIRFNQ